METWKGHMKDALKNVKAVEKEIQDLQAVEQDKQAEETMKQNAEATIKNAKETLNAAVENKQPLEAAINAAYENKQTATKQLEYLNTAPEARKKNPLPIKHVFPSNMKNLQMSHDEIEAQWKLRMQSSVPVTHSVPVRQQSSGGGAEPQAEDSVDDAN
eukprot:GHVS01016140.1.p1 GENE.GHVS01016140.1~~GHVS01016140.1.p1  ORF type:complete len:158 (+),score=36.25 GHVS01016140.1:704-1177(+)